MRGATDFLYILKEALVSIRKNLVTAVLSSLTVSFSLALFAVFLLVFANLNGAVRSFGEGTRVLVYMKDSAPEPVKARAEMMKVPGVKDAEYVSKEMALSELKAALKGHESVLEGVGSGFLPASFEVKIDERFRDGSKVEAVAARLKKLEGVESVEYSSLWVERFSAVLKLVELGAMIMGLFLAAATVFIVSNTVRLTVYARKEEIEVMRLVGASDAYIKMPFIIEGIAQGISGGVIAAGLVWVAGYLMRANLPAYLTFIAEMPFPLPAFFASLVLAGLVLGAGGSLISMSKFLKV